MQSLTPFKCRLFIPLPLSLQFWLCNYPANAVKKCKSVKWLGYKEKIFTDGNVYAEKKMAQARTLEMLLNLVIEPWLGKSLGEPFWKTPTHDEWIQNEDTRN
jgi:hypothetical protein